MGLHGRMHGFVSNLALVALVGFMQMNFARCVCGAGKHCLSAAAAAAAAAPGSAMQARAERRGRTSIGARNFHTSSMCDGPLFGGCENLMRLRGGKAKSKSRWKYMGDKAMNWTSVDQMQVPGKREASPPPPAKPHQHRSDWYTTMPTLIAETLPRKARDPLQIQASVLLKNTENLIGRRAPAKARPPPKSKTQIRREKWREKAAKAATIRKLRKEREGLYIDQRKGKRGGGAEIA